jgi:hypothetical protein
MAVAPPATPPLRVAPILLGGLAIAIADALFASWLWFGYTWPGQVRLFQTVAVGWLGPASFDGGLASAALGAASHLFLAILFVVVYVTLARGRPVLLRRPLLVGGAYGVALYLVMNFVVLPLSRVGRSPSFDHPDALAWTVLAHVGFGVMCALFARLALAR